MVQTVDTHEAGEAVTAAKAPAVSISIIIPAKDEASSISRVISGIHESLAGLSHEIIVVDDGSKDRTGDIAADHSVQVCFHERNRGKGEAMKTGSRQASGGIIVFLDADGVHNPRQIPELVLPILEKRADVVIGSRFLKRSRAPGAPLSRTLSNALAAFVITVIISLGVPLRTRFRSPLKWRRITDCTCGFRAVRKDAWHRLNIVSRGFEIETEMLYEMALQDLAILEVPISCNSGNGISHLSILQDGLKTLKLLARKFVSPGK